MFGYIKPYKPEMKIKEYAVFRAYYCGICKRMGRYGQHTRPLLCFEFAMLALVYDSVMQVDPVYEKHACVLGPLRKKPEVKSAGVDIAAALNVMLGYYKLADDAADEKKLYAKAAKGLLSGSSKRALRAYPALDGIVGTAMARQAEAERNPRLGIDAVADCFASMMRDICRELFQGTSSREPIARMAYNMGRFIYISDAFEDILKDYKRNVYNPFVLKYGAELINNNDTMERCCDDVRFLLNGCMKEIRSAYISIDFHANETVIDNIVFEGMPHKMNALINDEREERDGSVCSLRREP